MTPLWAGEMPMLGGPAWVPAAWSRAGPEATAAVPLRLAAAVARAGKEQAASHQPVAQRPRMFAGALAVASSALTLLAVARKRAHGARGARGRIQQRAVQRRRPKDEDDESFGRLGFNTLYREYKEADQKPQVHRRGKGSRSDWKRANQDLRDDPSYAYRWNIERKPSGKFFKAKKISQLTELDKEASELRALYKRPRFSWAETKNDDLRTAMLSRDLPAIGTGEVKLSKFLAHCGVCSRRGAAEMVLAGRVSVNGMTVDNIAMWVTPEQDKVYVDGIQQQLRTLGEIVWVMLYKPRGCISTLDDPQGRRTVMDLVPHSKSRRLVPIGRIDRNASGLMFMTNDYEWHSILTHPRHEHHKTYSVEIYNGVPKHDVLDALKKGLHLPDEKRPLLPIKDFQVTKIDPVDESVRCTFTLQQGLYRQIRRMFEYVGHPVKRIKRIQFGQVKLDKALRPGEWRVLTPKEVRRLKGPTILKRPRGHPDDRLQNEVQEYRASAWRERFGDDPRGDNRVDRGKGVRLTSTETASIREMTEEEWNALDDNRLQQTFSLSSDADGGRFDRGRDRRDQSDSRPGGRLDRRERRESRRSRARGYFDDEGNGSSRHGGDMDFDDRSDNHRQRHSDEVADGSDSSLSFEERLRNYRQQYVGKEASEGDERQAAEPARDASLEDLQALQAAHFSGTPES
mmetsp:Transcript_102769/g.257766  ORF Transcript_102769/g.257766 Transcript_102769/m.257766 type:complete len:683 (+) Transcript_102769:110-2158(+)